MYRAILSYQHASEIVRKAVMDGRCYVLRDLHTHNDTRKTTYFVALHSAEECEELHGEEAIRRSRDSETYNNPDRREETGPDSGLTEEENERETHSCGEDEADARYEARYE